MRIHWFKYEGVSRRSEHEDPGERASGVEYERVPRSIARSVQIDDGYF